MRRSRTYAASTLTIRWETRSNSLRAGRRVTPPDENRPDWDPGGFMAKAKDYRPSGLHRPGRSARHGLDVVEMHLQGRQRRLSELDQLGVVTARRIGREQAHGFLVGGELRA